MHTQKFFWLYAFTQQLTALSKRFSKSSTFIQLKFSWKIVQQK